jgi:peptide/nickel transport system substrate-binding protein
MSTQTLSRRTFLRAAAMAAAGAAVVACQPQTIVVEQEKIVKETVEVEKVVKETVEVRTEVTKIVEKEKVVEVTAVPQEVRESPDLFAQVAQGKLPPVEERLPAEPLLIQTVEEIGTYGGTWRRVANGPNDVGTLSSRLSYDAPLRYMAMGTEIVPHVARGWEASEDGSEFTFYLRKGHRWSDGEPYTADDIVFWHEAYNLSKDLRPEGVSSWLRINGEPPVVEKVDDMTVRFKFADTYGLFIQQVASANGMYIHRYACKHYLSQFHPDYVKQEELDKKVADASLDGWWNLFGDRLDWHNVERPNLWPWTATRMPPDLPAVAERNPYYLAVDPAGNQLPYIDRVRHEVVEDIELLNLKAIAGAIDMQFRHLSWENLPLFVQNADQGDFRVVKWSLAEGSNCCLHFNLNHEDRGKRELFETKEFRQALSLAINRKQVNEVVYMGLGVPRQAAVLPTVPWFKPEQAAAYADYDPQRANMMLDEIGLTERDEEGFRKRLDGEQLTIAIEYAPVFGPWSDVLQMVSQYWADVGVRAFPNEEARTLFSERGSAGTLMDIGVWMMDRAAHPLLDGLYQRPQRSNTPPSTGALYEDWWTSNGENGEEPPPEVKRAYELYDLCKTAKNDEELAKYATELLDLNAEQLWFVGIVGLLPHVGVVKNNFRNVPEEAVSDWLCMSPGNTNIEQYFYKET